MALQHRLGTRIGLLQVDAPVLELLERDRHAGDGAAHERARPDHAKVAVEELDLGFAGHRRWAVVAIEHLANPSKPRRWNQGLPGGTAAPNIMAETRAANPLVPRF